MRLLAASYLGTEALDTLAVLVREPFGKHPAKTGAAAQRAKAGLLPAVVGSTAAVPALRALVEDSRPFDINLRRAVDKAMAKIQARLSGAAAGQVALAGGGGGAGAGRVSLAAADAAGNVTLAADEPEGCRDRRDLTMPATTYSTVKPNSA